MTAKANPSLRPFADPAIVHEHRPADALTEPAPSLWERVICGVIIAMMTGALIGPVFAPLQEETPMLRLVWLPAYAAIFGALAMAIAARALVGLFVPASPNFMAFFPTVLVGALVRGVRGGLIATAASTARPACDAMARARSMTECPSESGQGSLPSARAAIRVQFGTAQLAANMTANQTPR